MQLPGVRFASFSATSNWEHFSLLTLQESTLEFFQKEAKACSKTGPIKTADITCQHFRQSLDASRKKYPDFAQIKVFVSSHLFGMSLAVARSPFPVQKNCQHSHVFSVGSYVANSCIFACGCCFSQYVCHTVTSIPH